MNLHKISGAVWCGVALNGVFLSTTSATTATNFYFMTVNAELKGYKDRYGKQAIYIRISKNGKRTYKKTQIKILPSEWHKGKVKNTHPNHELFNGIIKKLLIEAEANFFNSPKYPDADFYKYCTNCLNEWDKTKATETIRQYRSEINKLKSFTPSVRLSAITPEWLNRYKAFCFKNSINTVHKNLKFVRLIIRKAHKERLIEQNPFDIFEMPKYRDPEKKYLTREQINLIEEISRDENLSEIIRFVASWFCIGCYTGLRFSDMQQFDMKKHIVNNRIVLYTTKTKTPVSMPVSDKLKTLFEQVNYKGVHITNIHYNRILKAVGAITGLGNINAHQSRHSFAIMVANAGISMEVAAKLLGHTSLRSTAIYYHITNIRIDDEIKKLK